VATIRDVAREARVSIATVSRVFNQTTLVTPETSNHVRAVAARMDYWPNSAARSLITQRAHAIGVVLPDLFGEFFSEVIRGIDLAARREKFQLLVSSSHANAETLVTAVRSLRGRIDGLIVMAPDADATDAIREFSHRFPVVLLNPGTITIDCGAISIANFDGAYQAVRHLAGLGHRSIAMVRGPERNLDAQERRRGYRQALEDAGLEWSPSLEIAGDFSEAAGFHAGAELLRMRPRPTAAFVANDYMAIGLLSSLRDAGIRVPRDMGLCAFDDIMISQYLSPALTTVRVDAYELGERAMQQLMPYARARKPAERHHETLPTKLIIRSSCGAEQPAAPEPRARRGHHRMVSSAGAHGGDRTSTGSDGASS